MSASARFVGADKPSMFKAKGRGGVFGLKILMKASFAMEDSVMLDEQTLMTISCRPIKCGLGANQRTGE
ncbi:hypothetical protein OCEANICA350_20032 [Oceanicaulis sp. 350]|nr:hypothetical protein OCEANICA350_20032 [Oceanicaulis sp. 350]